MIFKKEILQLETDGYINPPLGMVIWLRNRDEFKNIRKFKVSHGGKSGSQKYSCFDIFGQNSFYFIYKIDQSEKFVKFLVKSFYLQNPNPDIGLRKTFTQILHANYLSWFGEYKYS